MTMRSMLFGTALLAAIAPCAAAQKWKDIGKTSSGNAVSVDPRSVKKKDGGLVAASIRVVFTPPVKAANGTWASSRTSATFDCGKKSLAVSESVFYSDVKSTKVIERKVNKLPGFGPALGGSPPAVALEYLCKS